MVFREAEFSDGSRISHTGELYPKGGANLLFGQNDPENCMKMKKKLGREGKGGDTSLMSPSLDPPLELDNSYVV